MLQRSIWTTIFILVLVGLVKAQWHFIKLAMLGGMGLGGLWMIHKLAQDFTRIRNPKSADLTRFLSKRSLEDNLASAAGWQNLDAEFNSILREDPHGCAQRTLCEIAASPETLKGTNEQNILKFIHNVSRSFGGAAFDAFKEAAALGAASKHFRACARVYPNCPHSREKIIALLRLHPGHG